jgi:hypothetical protein
MNRRDLISAAAAIAVGVVIASAPSFAATDPFLGTWVLNVAKSTANPGPLPKSDKLVTTDVGGGKWKSVDDTVGADGKASHVEITYSLDGKDSPVVPAPAAGSGAPDAYAVTRVDASTLKIVGKSGGKVVMTIVAKVSADGKTQTGTVTGTTPDGKPTTETDVYDRQ